MNSDQLKKALVNLASSHNSLKQSLSNKLFKSNPRIFTLKSLRSSQQIYSSKSRSKSRPKSITQSKKKHKHNNNKLQTKLIQKTEIRKQTDKNKTNTLDIKTIKKKQTLSKYGYSNNISSQNNFKISRQVNNKRQKCTQTPKHKKQMNTIPCFKKKIRQSNRLYQSKKQSLSKIVKQLFKTQQSSPRKQFQETKQMKYIKQNNNSSQIKDFSIIYTAISTPSSLVNQQTNDIFKHQSQITPKMRCILIDWMIIISSQLHLYRQTAHLSIMYLDIYISKQQVSKSQLQLCGIACLIIAVKEQQNQNSSKISQLLSSCGEEGKWTSQDVFEMQKTIMFALQFKLRLYTHSFWIDYLTEKWDKYIIFKTDSLKQLKFRYQSNKQITLLKQIYQIVDGYIYLNDTVLSNKPKSILGVMYLIIRTKLQSILLKSKNEQMQLKKMSNLFSNRLTPLFKDKVGMNDIFNQFMVSATGCQLDTIFNEIKLMSKYLRVDIDYGLVQNQKGNKYRCQQIMKYQTHNENIIKFAMNQLINN